MTHNKDNRIKLIDKDIADLIFVLKFVITGTGATHDENIRAKRLMKRFINYLKLSKRNSAVSSLIKEDISRVKLDDLI